MGTEVKSRVENLERAALEFEGAQFAIRHVLANLLSRLDRHEAEECLHELQSTGRRHGVELGERRLTGYLDELEALKEASVSVRNVKAPTLRAVS
jgi:hypothetical protein